MTRAYATSVTDNCIEASIQLVDAPADFVVYLCCGHRCELTVAAANS
jgi:hypothetical protein